MSRRHAAAEEVHEQPRRGAQGSSGARATAAREAPTSPSEPSRRRGRRDRQRPARPAQPAAEPARRRRAHARAPAGGRRRRRPARPHDARRRDRARDGDPRPRPPHHRGPDRRTSTSCSAARPTASAARSTARAARPASAPSFPITGYENLSAAQVQARLARPHAGRAAQGARLRAPQREPQDGPRGDRVQARLMLRLAWSRVSAPASSSRPRPGTDLELVVDRLAYGGKGVARLDGYVVFVAGGLPGDRVLARVEKSKRAYAEARAIEVLEPSPDRLEPVADHPGAPWQVLPYERQLATKAEQVEDALRRIGRLDGFELEPIVPALEQWRYRNKLEYSFGTGADGELICGFHAPGPLRRDRPGHATTSSRPSSGNELREQVLAVCREPGLPAWDRRTQRGLLRNLVVREGRRTGQYQVRLVTSPGDAAGRGAARARRGRRPVVDADRGPGGEHERRPLAAAGRHAAARGPARRPALPDLARGVLSDQHRDGRGPLRRRRRVRRPARHRARLRPLLRHRHDRA